MENLVINGVEYAPIQPAPAQGTRTVVVVDRGWIFAGDASIDTTGMLTLTNAVHVFSWESLCFHGMLADPTNNKVELKKMQYNVEIPAASIIFKVPVCDSWGV